MHLSPFTVTPSSFQINEGDSLNTSLSGFTPGSILFFKVSGRGINKKDFAAGGVKGSVKVDANGVATISHTLTADKATEGDESFAIQVFSDKKMRNLLGQSDAVTVFDTSVKAVKAVKTPKAGGSKSGPKPKVDIITGEWAEEGYFISGTGFDEDGPYEDEGAFGFFKSNKLPNGRYIFDQASYNPSDPSKERAILFDDVNTDNEYDPSTDKIWGYAVLSKQAIDIIRKDLDFPFPSSTENAGTWEAQISTLKSTGKAFKAGFHIFDIQIVDPSVFG